MIHEKLKLHVENNPILFLIFVIIFAAVLRVVFFTGQIFSDDAYYNQLAINFLEETYPSNYIGYPIFLLRKLETLMTAAGFLILGKNEIGSVLFPFLFSLASIVLIYFTALRLLQNNNAALIAAFLLAIFPVDILFASINFPDLTAAFFLNFGIFLLLKYRESGRIYFSVFAGISFSLSLFLKVNFTFVSFLLAFLAIYYFLKERKIEKGILISLVIPTLVLLLEAVFYNFSNSDFFYRIQIMQENFTYAYYDFFPNNLIQRKELADSYTSALFLQWLLNIKSVFLRRFYLLLPALALVQSIVLVRHKKNKLLAFWFLGLTVLYLFFTSSFMAYIPLDLTSGWYIYPLFFPTIILSSMFISSRTSFVQSAALLAAFIFSLIMASSLNKFFDMENIDALKFFLEKNNSIEIFTDHHTAYGVDLIDGYPETRRTNYISRETSLDEISAGQMVIYNPDVVEELKLQGFFFPDFAQLENQNYKKLNAFGKFFIYQKK